MTAPELKPCPFCGGKPYLANVEMVGCAYVVCTDCRTQSDDMSKDRAIEQWNTRTDTIPDPMDDPRVVALVRASRGAIDALNAGGNNFHMMCARILTAALSTITKEPPHDP
jgi:Lar family restriction alleviation protein